MVQLNTNRELPLCYPKESTEEYRTFHTVIISSELYKFTELYEILLSMAFGDTFAFLKLGRFHRVNVSEYYRVILWQWNLILYFT